MGPPREHGGMASGRSRAISRTCEAVCNRFRIVSGFGIWEWRSAAPPQWARSLRGLEFQGSERIASADRGWRGTAPLALEGRVQDERGGGEVTS